MDHLSYLGSLMEWGMHSTFHAVKIAYVSGRSYHGGPSFIHRKPFSLMQYCIDSVLSLYACFKDLLIIGFGLLLKFQHMQCLLSHNDKRQRCIFSRLNILFSGGSVFCTSDMVQPQKCDVPHNGTSDVRSCSAFPSHTNYQHLLVLSSL